LKKKKKKSHLFVPFIVAFLVSFDERDALTEDLLFPTGNASHKPLQMI